MPLGVSNSAILFVYSAAEKKQIHFPGELKMGKINNHGLPKKEVVRLNACQMAFAVRVDTTGKKKERKRPPTAYTELRRVSYLRRQQVR